MTQQLAVRIPDELARELDELVESGRIDNRADGVRRGIRALVEQERRGRIDAAIVDGYRRIPPTEVEDRWADASGRQMINEESW